MRSICLAILGLAGAAAIAAAWMLVDGPSSAARDRHREAARADSAGVAPHLPATIAAPAGEDRIEPAPPDEPDPESIANEKLFRLTGHVTDDRDRPLSGALVSWDAALQSALTEEMTDEEGRFRLFVPPSLDSVLPAAEHPGFARTHAAEAVLPRSREAQDLGTIALPPESPLRVRFVDSRGDPVSGLPARVSGSPCASPACGRVAPQRFAGAHSVEETSDGEGELDVRGLHAGRAVIRWGNGSEEWVEGSREVVVDPGARTELTIEVERAAFVAGLALQSDGAPLPGPARIRVLGADRRERQAEPREDGTFRVGGLRAGTSVRLMLETPPDLEVGSDEEIEKLQRLLESRPDIARGGRSSLTVLPPWISAAVIEDVPAGTEGIVLRVDPRRLGTEVILRCVDAETGGSVKPAWLAVRRDGEGVGSVQKFEVLRRRISPLGEISFHLAPLGPGRYRLEARAPSYAPGSSVPFTADPEGSAVVVEIRFRASALLEGRVVLPVAASEKRTTVRVTVLSAAAGRARSVSSTSSSAVSSFPFSFDDLGPGTWRLRAEADGAEPYETTIDLAPGERREGLVIPLLARPR